MTSLEHKVDMHRLASERRSQGRPVWDRKINMKGVLDRDAPFEEIRDEVVRRLRHSTWMGQAGEDSELDYAIQELADTTDADEFDYVWNEIYDLADWDRVWIETF